MHMSYWFGSHVSDLLFRGFTITSTAGILIISLGLVSITILFEGLRVYQAYLKQKIILGIEHCVSQKCSGEEESLLSPDRFLATFPQRWKLILAESVWYVIQIILSYVLMLCIMTYNGYFTIAISLGAGLGYFVFGPELLRISVKNGGFLRPKRMCKKCLETIGKNEEAPLIDSPNIPAVEEGMIHCAVPAPEVQEQPQCCQKSVAQVHRVDV